MSTTFYTADLHIGHRLVAGLRGFGRLVSEPGERPRFDGVDTAAHDDLIRRNWWETVGIDDVVHVLGDLAVTSSEDGIMAMLAFVGALPGRKRLVLGNHDPRHPMHDGHERWAGAYGEVFESVDTLVRRRIAGRRVMLSHFPYGNDMRHIAQHDGIDRYAAFRPVDAGLWLLHGHTHSGEIRREGPREIHVGLDAWAMKPVPQSRIEAILGGVERPRR